MATAPSADKTPSLAKPVRRFFFVLRRWHKKPRVRFDPSHVVVDPDAPGVFSAMTLRPSRSRSSVIAPSKVTTPL